MNVYSVRLLPKLKIRLCQFFGVATAMAIDELGDRLRRIDQKMDRFDAQLRRIHRRQMALEAMQAKSQPKQKKKQNSSTKKGGVKKVHPDSAVTPLAPRIQPDPEPLPLVFLVQTDVRSGEVIKNYFAGVAEVKSINGLKEISKKQGKRRLEAVFFERTLLGDPNHREELAKIKKAKAKTRWVGISSYLTLALTRAAQGEAEFGQTLTQPITTDNLSGLFEEKRGGLALSAGRD